MKYPNRVNRLPGEHWGYRISGNFATAHGEPALLGAMGLHCRVGKGWEPPLGDPGFHPATRVGRKWRDRETATFISRTLAPEVAGDTRIRLPVAGAVPAPESVAGSVKFEEGLSDALIVGKVIVAREALC